MVEIYAFPSHAPQLLQPLQHILLPHVWQCSLKKGFGFFGQYHKHHVWAALDDSPCLVPPSISLLNEEVRG